MNRFSTFVLGFCLVAVIYLEPTIQQEVAETTTEEAATTQVFNNNNNETIAAASEKIEVFGESKNDLERAADILSRQLCQSIGLGIITFGSLFKQLLLLILAKLRYELIGKPIQLITLKVALIQALVAKLANLFQGLPAIIANLFTGLIAFLSNLTQLKLQLIIQLITNLPQYICTALGFIIALPFRIIFNLILKPLFILLSNSLQLKLLIARIILALKANLLQYLLALKSNFIQLVLLIKNLFSSILAQKLQLILQNITGLPAFLCQLLAFILTAPFKLIYLILLKGAAIKNIIIQIIGQLISGGGIGGIGGGGSGSTLLLKKLLIIPVLLGIIALAVALAVGIPLPITLPLALTGGGGGHGEFGETEAECRGDYCPDTSYGPPPAAYGDYNVPQYDRNLVQQQQQQHSYNPYPINPYGGVQQQHRLDPVVSNSIESGSDPNSYYRQQQQQQQAAAFQQLLPNFSGEEDEEQGQQYYYNPLSQVMNRLMPEKAHASLLKTMKLFHALRPAVSRTVTDFIASRGTRGDPASTSEEETDHDTNNEQDYYNYYSAAAAAAA